jgi:hypothetical protein
MALPADTNPSLHQHSEFEQKPQEISNNQVLYWARSIIEEKFRRSNYLISPAITRDFLSLVYANETREVFSVIFLDNQNGVLAYQNLFQGTIDGAAVYPREIVKAALAHNAAAVILAHNHPSGVAEPSRGRSGRSNARHHGGSAPRRRRHRPGRSGRICGAPAPRVTPAFHEHPRAS